MLQSFCKNNKLIARQHKKNASARISKKKTTFAIMFRISKQFAFSASHILNRLGDDHPCARLHGHNYVITMHLQSETLNEHGFVVDYRDLREVKDYIDTHLDHRHLNDIIDTHPTAENIARYIYDKFTTVLPQLYAVEVSETPKTSALYEPAR